MANTAQQAYDDIVAHINKQGGAYSSWYAGIAADPKDRLKSGHGVALTNDNWWIHRACSTDDDAREVEKALLDLGCDGGPSGGDHATKSVYAYLKTSSTDP